MEDNTYVMAEPFYKQELLRNVAIGYAPYLPFSQQYRLQMNSDFAGRGTGYMAYGPEAESGADSSPAMSQGYGWDLRRNVYKGLGEKRLSHMSRYYGPQGRWAIAQQVAPQETAAEAGQEALRFKNIIDDAFKGPYAVEEHIGQEMSSSVYDELGLGNISKLLDAELTAKGKRPEDIFEHEVDRKLQRGIGYSSQGYDLHLEEHRSIVKFLEQKVPNFNSNVRSMETSQARVSKKSDKGMMNMRTAPEGYIGNETNALITHAGNQAEKLNRMIWHFVTNMTDEQKSGYKNLSDSIGPWGALRSVIGSTMDKGGKYSKLSSLTSMGISSIYKDEEWKALKQFLDRHRRDEVMSVQSGLAKNAMSHIYQNTMPNGFIGLTIMRGGYRGKKINGMVVPEFWKPNIGDAIALQGGADGNLAGAMTAWAVEEGVYADSATAQEMLGAAYDVSYGQAILGAGREEAILHEAYTGAEWNVSQGLYDLKVGGINSTVSLVPTEIAKNLYEQITHNLHKGKAGTEMQNWFQNLIIEANTLSKAWYDRMPYGMRASMSEEFQYGDDEGNPNKHFLGVWNQGGVGAWQGDVGQNISMAPFIIARRQKVANWRDGGFQEDR